jgi:hypothetical protein
MTFISSPYFVVFIFLAMLSLITADRRGKKYTDISLFLSFVVLSLLSGLRDSSPDQASYALIFREIPSLIELVIGGRNYEAFSMEWGFLFLLSVIKTFTSSETVMFVSLSCLTVGGVVYACKKLSPYPVLSVLIYFSWFYYSNLGALRHALLSSVLILAIVFVVNNKFFKLWFAYISSIFIHKIGLFSSFLYLVNKKRFTSKIYFLLLLFSLLIAINGGLFFFAYDLIYNYLPESWQEKVYLYVTFSANGSFDTNFGGQESIFRGSTVKHSLIVAFALIYFKALESKFFDKFSITFGVYVFSLIFMFLFLDFKIATDRISNYLAISEIIIIPMLITLFSVNDRPMVFFTIILGLLYQVYRLVGNQLYPYKFILL